MYLNLHIKNKTTTLTQKRVEKYNRDNNNAMENKTGENYQKTNNILPNTT